IGSKHLFCVDTGRGKRHFYNPSNFGITITLLLFPWVGIAQPYHFTENLDFPGDWILPAVIICSGTFLNTRYTKRLPLIVAWLTVFVAQAYLRHVFLGAELAGALMPMTGIAFILYTFYMVTDPPTTPSTTRSQIMFGASVATVYGLLMVSHVVFGLFFALTTVSTVRGLYLVSRSWTMAWQTPESLPAVERLAAPQHAVREPALAATAER
ncbi:MAG TPA: enediyne biosynthesis protein UnbU, partial [Anaerolineae bacterium]